MRILFLTRVLNYGGAERQLVTLAKGLHELGHRVAVAVIYPGGPLERELQKAGVPLLLINKNGRWDVFGFLLRLIRCVKREKPDVLHGYLIFPNILTVLLMPIFPNLRTAWGVRASNLDLNSYDWLERLSYRAECWLSRFADMIIVNSRAGLDHAAAHGFPKSRMIVIPNGIDTKRFRPDKEAGRRVRAEWGVSESQKPIGLVGRLDRMKDHSTFLQAASALARERKDVRFVCVGDGPAGYRQELMELSKKLCLAERIVWAGARDDMPAVYNALDIVVSCSYGEGFPNVIGEAMACGVPCVVTDVGDSAWIVGEIGEVVPPTNPKALKAAIEISLKKLSDIGYEQECNRQRIVDRFSAFALVARTEAILLHLSQGVGAV